MPNFCFLEYGEKENEDLRERFQVKKEDYPVFKLFKQGQKEPIDFSQDVTNEELSRFVRLESGLWLGKRLNYINCKGRDVLDTEYPS